MKTILSLAPFVVLVLSTVITLGQAPSTWEAIQITNNENDSMSLSGNVPHESLTLGSLFYGGGVAWENGQIVEDAELASFDGMQCELIDIGDIKPALTNPPNLHRGVIYIADYLDGIVYAYGFYHDEQEPSAHRLRIAYFDGFDHELLFEFDSPENKHTIYSVDDVIYVAGELYTGEVVFLKYENGSLEPFLEVNPPESLGVNGVFDMMKYQNELYFVLSLSGSPRRLFKYNEQGWSVVSDAAGNEPYNIPWNHNNKALWVYNGFLVVNCNVGSEAEYNPSIGNGDGVLFWDGQSWSGPGPLASNVGPDGTLIYYFAAVGTDLYARGTFSTIDGASLWGLAKWNGSQWCGLQAGPEVYTTIPVPIATFQGAVYLTPQISWGSFYHIYRHDGETFAPCTLPLDIEELERPPGALNAFPNPANRNLTVTLNDHNPHGVIELHINDLQGRIVYRQNHPELVNGEARIAVNHLPAGLYTLHCTVDGVWVDAVKIVVE